MKIALISPKGPLYRYKGGIFKKSLRYQPLTLTTLASLIPADMDADVAVYDEGIQDVPLDLNADLIGITVITGNSTRSYELAKIFRSRGIKVVLGGPHVTLVPDEAQEHADAICVGYAEDTWPELLRDFQNNELKKIYRQAHDFTLDRPDMPFPKRDLFDKSNFLTQAVFEATRSCAHNCEFCVAPAAWGRKQFQKPISWVIDDIRQVGQKKILFIDLNLISDKNYAKELFEALIPLKIKWFGLSTVLIVNDPELMQLMARSGCKGLLLGLETINDDNLATTKKRFNSQVSYKEVIQSLHELGIAIQGCFVFGLDHDDKHVFDATVEFAIDSGIDLPRFALLTPFPGTPLFTRLENEGRILTKNWELYDAQHVVFQPRHMSPEELAAGHERAWKKIYRYSSIAKRLWRAKNFKPLLVSANLGYRFYAHHLHEFYNCDWQISACPILPTVFAEKSEGQKIVCG